MNKTLSIIVAVAEDNGIGNENNLLTYISNDLKRFKEITKGHTVVMGHNTWLSLPNRPLPNRTNIVITGNKNLNFEGAIAVNSIEEAISACPENQESFIIGGAKLYQQFLPIASKLYLTKMHKVFTADTFFPEVKATEWKEVSRTKIIDDEKAGIEYSFINLVRV